MPSAISLGQKRFDFEIENTPKPPESFSCSFCYDSFVLYAKFGSNKNFPLNLITFYIKTIKVVFNADYENLIMIYSVTRLLVFFFEEMETIAFLLQ